MEDYVDDIKKRSILIVAHSDDNVKVVLQLGGSAILGDEASRMRIEYDTEDQLASILQRLRDAGIAFAGGSSGWPPAEVAVLLRDKGKVHGEIREIIRWYHEIVVRPR